MTKSPAIPEGFSPVAFTFPVPFVEVIGPVYERILENGVDVGAWVTDSKRNGGEIAHGGFLMTLGDIATGRTTTVVKGEESFFVHVNFTMDFYAPAKLGAWVEARARAERKGKSMLFCGCDYYADGEKIGHTTCILKATNFKPSHLIDK